MIRALLLVLALAAPSAAENVFPAVINDEPMQRNLDFLYDEIRNATQTTAATKDGFVSSSTYLAAGLTVTQTSFASCVNSTVTITTGQTGPLDLIFSGIMHNNVDAAATRLAVLVNGSLPSGVSEGIIYLLTSPAATRVNASFHFVTRDVAAGTYSACLVGRVSTGTGTICESGTCEARFTIRGRR